MVATFLERMRSVATSRPDQPAVLLDDGEHRTFDEHWTRVGQIRSRLRRRGLSRSDTFAVVSDNGPELLELLHAALCGACRAAPVNTRLAAPEMSAVLDVAGASTVFLGRAYEHLAERFAAERREVVLLDAAGWRREVAAAEPVDDVDDVDPGGVPLVLFTGGSTGRPKGVMLSQGALAADLEKMDARLAELATDRIVFLQQNAMFHSSALLGILWVPSVGGASCFVPRFEAGAVRAAVARHGVTLTTMVPTTMQSLADSIEAADPAELRSLVGVCYGGSAISAGLLRRLVRLLPGVQLFGGYGMTETCGHITALGPSEHIERVGTGSSGRALPGTVVRTVDAMGTPCAEGVVGELLVETDNIMTGYLRGPSAAIEPPDEPFHTGDLGFLYQGHVHVVGRLKDMIVTGGENVYAGEVEAVISALEAVAAVAVLGVPDERWGEAVHAVVVAEPGRRLDPERIVADCRSALANYKVPKRIHVYEGPLPTTGVNKVDKTRLRRELVEPYRVGSG